jgi:4'-phosphopantetheinyl transferase
MRAPGWLTRDLADVPTEDDWLSDAERVVLSGLRVAKRRCDWRLGRWTAKAAVGAFRDLPAWSVEVLAASDGAPEAWIDGAPVGVSLSLSHRAGRALAVVSEAAGAIGCDLEVIEPRSAAFVREWLAPAEQALVAAAAPDERNRLVNLVWTTKEAACKARRQGLRLDLRNAVTDLVGGSPAAHRWGPLTVNWAGAPRSIAGWWRHEPGWVIAIAGETAPMIPHMLTARERASDLIECSG